LVFGIVSIFPHNEVYMYSLRLSALLFQDILQPFHYAASVIPELGFYIVENIPDASLARNASDVSGCCGVVSVEEGDELGFNNRGIGERRWKSSS
jgi:hypothetical protein